MPDSLPGILRPLASCIILIVEDERFTADILKLHLRNAGYSQVVFTEHGAEALAFMRKSPPDIIILDLMMPGMDGFELCKLVRADASLAHIPILVQTSLTENSHKILAFECGASDYICKPANSAELMARIRVHLMSKLLREAVVNQQAQMRAELNDARAMQMKLLPSHQHIVTAEEKYGLQIAEHFETSSLMGGDCWGLRPLSDTRLALYMFDFSGHGMRAAMNVFRLHTLMQELLPMGGDAGAFLTTLNRQIHPQIERNAFATMLYGIIDIKTGMFEYAAAAAPPVLMLRKNGNTEWLDSSGFLLGPIVNNVYPTMRTAFAPGDALVMVSDCFIESLNEQRQHLSEADIIHCTYDAREAPVKGRAKAIKQSLLRRLRSHAPGPVKDDLTINVYCRE